MSSGAGGEGEGVGGGGGVEGGGGPGGRQGGGGGAARRHGVGYSLDPHEEYIVGHEEQVHAMARGAMLMPSLLELDQLLPELAGLPDLERAERGSALLLARGAQAVVVKCGASGSFIRTAELAQHVPAQRLDHVIDTTRARDAYARRFLARYLRSTPLTWGAVRRSLSAA